MAVVDNVLYVFGGRGADGKDLDDLAAFNLNSQSPSLPLLRHFRGLPNLAAFNLNSQSPSLPLLRHFRGLPKLG